MPKKVNTNRLPAGLVAYWWMDEGTGDVALDLTGNGHHMRLWNSVGSDPGDPTWVTPGMPELGTAKCPNLGLVVVDTGVYGYGSMQWRVTFG